ncbi:hypothetical protein H0H93_010667 [Arthromyces matolae]|nr:hypothetical protein H0H93_010667 [Arthromyces matolae]
MLLKFTTTDILDTALVDVSTGERAFDIVTENTEPQSQIDDSAEPSTSSNGRRYTSIKDASGACLVSITWTGRRPDITIFDEKVGQLTDLFGSSTVKFMPKIMAVPTRFDTEYVWTATPDSLTLVDYDSDTVKGTFHQNVIRLPSPFKSRSSKSSPSSRLTSTVDRVPSTTPSVANLFLPSSFSKISLSSSLSSSSSSFSHQPHIKKTSPSTFIPTHLPGIGGNYLEFDSHPLAHDVEIIVSFLMMEILRRGRFSLTPYDFQRPKLWQLKEARDLMLRRIRRNTV